MDDVLEMLQRPREVALVDQRLADKHVSQEEVERVARALGGGQSLLRDLSRGRQVTLHEIGRRHSHEYARQLGRLADLGRQLACPCIGLLVLGV